MDYIQTMDHILFRCPSGQHGEDSDLKSATEAALA